MTLDHPSTAGSPPPACHPLRPPNDPLLEEIILLQKLMDKDDGDGHNEEYLAVLNETLRHMMARELGEQ